MNSPGKNTQHSTSAAAADTQGGHVAAEILKHPSRLLVVLLVVLLTC